MDSAPPPEPPPARSIEPQPPPPRDEGWSWRKTIWVVFAVVVVAPMAWVPTAIAVTVVYEATRVRKISEGILYVVMPLPVVLAVVIGVARRGLKRDWHLRPAILGGWGIAAAGVVAVPVLLFLAFAAGRSTSQEKAVLGNTRQVAAAADEYFLENGTTTVGLPQLIGPTNYIKALNLVAGEKYPTHYTQGVTITVTGIAGARTVTYAP